MKEKLAKLIDVKSIMTLVLTMVFCALALMGVISGQEFLTIFTVIVGFYFGTQSQKQADTTATQSAAEPVATVADAPQDKPETVDTATYSQTHPDEAE